MRILIQANLSFVHLNGTNFLSSFYMDLAAVMVATLKAVVLLGKFIPVVPITVSLKVCVTYIYISHHFLSGS